MTPQERELITELFDRLTTLESKPRDRDAEQAIIEGLRQAPNATYALVQTALVQDEALKRADAHIRELEARLADEPAAAQPAGFLDNMRDALLGRRETPRGGSVPSVRPGQDQRQGPGQTAMGAPPRDEAPLAAGAPWRQGPAAPGGSFLGTAASAAAGVIGGSLLLDGIRSMMGHGQGTFGLADPALGASHNVGSPWDNSTSGDLGRQAGVDDIGRDQHGGDAGGSGSGLFDASDERADNQSDQDVGGFDDSDDSGSDFGGGGDFGDSEA
jgi:uncharacterized protein